MTLEARWVIGVVVGITAMIGLMILVALISFALEPPAWLQILVGVVLVGVACLLAWLVASALGQRDRARGAEDEVERRRRAAQSASREPTSR
jgi:membrane protein implicated in regulation of membrane protease activity